MTHLRSFATARSWQTFQPEGTRGRASGQLLVVRRMPRKGDDHSLDRSLGEGASSLLVSWNCH